MKNIWKQHKIKIVALLYVIISAALLYFMAFFMMKKIINKSDEIQALILDREIENSRVESLAKMEEDFKYSQENIKMLDVVLSQEEGVDFIKKMENIALETGNKISFSVEETEKKKEDKSKTANKKEADKEKSIKDSLLYDNYLSIKIDLKGDYKGFISFVNKLENTRNYVNIVSIESKTEKESDDKSTSNRSGGIFSPTAILENQTSPEKKEKNILHSAINVVVYIKK
ncbi:MAG TPA: hypothetical protein VK255_02650 [Patescibacteria group bacterium]|nr:hypothetical protein [Patescibacteria group bacterium]